MMLANTPYPETMQTQLFLAPAFFSLDLRKQVDDWAAKNDQGGDVYLLSEKQLLTATIMVLSAPRGERTALPQDGPLTTIGQALLHISNDLDPLQELTRAAAIERTPAQRQVLAEFVLRNGFFYSDDDHRYAISRYDEMFSAIAPSLTADAEFVDIQAVFKRTTGLKFRTYLAMGLTLLTTFHSATRDTSGAPVFIRTRRIFKHTAVRKSARLFFRETAIRRRAFTKGHRQDLKRYGNIGENFLEAERHPLVCVRKDSAYCVNLKFLERKFSAGIHHVILRGCDANERRRYLSFFGRVFERYVHRVCDSTFGDRFIPGFKYGKPEAEAADGWILYPRRAVILEAKSARFSIAVRMSGDLNTFERAFRESILRAARQLSRAIDDFRAGKFTVADLRDADLPRLLPVVVTLDYVPFDHFLSRYMDEMLTAEGLLSQERVGRLTVLSIKDLEHIEGAISTGANFADLLEEQSNSAVWRAWPFSNFLFDRFPAGFNVNSVSVERFKGLLRHAALAVLGARLEG